MAIATLRVDGGMSANPTFDARRMPGRPVEVSPVTEATTLGAAFLAGMALGIWADEADAAAAWKPSSVVEPQSTERSRTEVRARWIAARDRARATIPELTALEF